VTFDPKLIEAKLTLKRIGPEQMPSLACDALEAGLDGPSIRRLAGLINPSGWEMDQILRKFMAETGLGQIPLSVAALRLASDLAQRILSEGLDPLNFTGHFYRLFVDAAYPAAIQEAAFLDDEKEILDYTGQTKAEFREHARQVLSALISQREEAD